jgi:ATP-dependent RNA helicase RhlE
MPAEIADLATHMLRDPVRIAVTPAATTVERIAQRVIHLDRGSKPALLAEILRQDAVARTLVFTRTKRGADKVVRALAKAGLAAEAIHGNKSQGQRERVLAAFRSGRLRTLIATDIAARGIDVEGISHVVNYDLPNIPESYVHRIGRTARAGADGVAISFCDPEEAAFLRDIERLIRMSIPATDRGRSRRAPTEHRAHHTNGAMAAKPPRHHQGDNRKHQARGDRKPPRGSAQQQRRKEPTAGGAIGAIAFMQPTRRGSRRPFHAGQRAPS